MPICLQSLFIPSPPVLNHNNVIALYLYAILADSHEVNVYVSIAASENEPIYMNTVLGPSFRLCCQILTCLCECCPLRKYSPLIEHRARSVI